MLLTVAVVVVVVLLRHVGSSAAPVASPTHPTSTAPKTSSTVPSHPTSTTSTLAPIPPGDVKLLVLNGTLTGTLAGDTAKKLSTAPGYNTLAGDNTTAAVTTSSVIAVSPQYVSAANALAAMYDLPSSAVQTSVPANAPIATAEKTIANVILIIGPDLAPRLAG